MSNDFTQIEWDEATEEDCRQIARLAVREDLDRSFDWTTLALVSADASAEASVVARADGVACGLRAAELAISQMDGRLIWAPSVKDGDRVEKGQPLATLAGPARSMLTAERILLNFIGRLSGVATLASRYLSAVAGTKARIYDTRKTTPGWRRLEKYAVHCGGGTNHRTGLFDAILIKDNHLALAASGANGEAVGPAEAVRRARAFVEEMAAERTGPPLLVEVEVDSLAQLEQVLPVSPDIVLLDNMTQEQLRQAVAMRDRLAAEVELEASGGVNLDTVAAIAACGVERISVGGLTHSASSLDVALDWKTG